MKKRIVIEVEENKKEDIKNNIKLLKNSDYIDFIIYMIGYAIVLLLASYLFSSFHISKFFYAFLGAIIIYILNKTIKPLLVTLTMPINMLSLGITYPIVNVIILYLTSFILGKNFTIHGIIAPFFIAIFISTLNILVEGFIIKPIIYNRKK